MSPASIKPPVSVRTTASKYDEFPMSLIASPDLDFSFDEPANDYDPKITQRQLELHRLVRNNYIN